MPSLSDRLKSLGVKIGAHDLPSPQAERIFSIESVLEGKVIPTHLGETFAVESRYSSGYAQGSVPIKVTPPLHGIADWIQEDRLRQISSTEIAFLDTETTGLSGGTGTYAFLIGVGRFDGDDFHLAQFFMRDPVEESGQLAALEEFLAPCSTLVTFNGKAFDIPLLVTRYMTHGWRPPFVEHVHIDLLHLARRLWRARLPSRTLSSLEYNILGALRTEEDVPGWMIPQMYFDYLRTGDARPLKSVFYHNAMDVLSLAALLNHTSGLLADPFNAQLDHAEDIYSIARLHEDEGNLSAAIQLYQQGLEGQLPEETYLEALQRLARLYKRQGNFDAAIPLWEMAAQHKHIDSHVELAKYYEHLLRDYETAIVWTQRAIEIIHEPEFNLFEQRNWLAEMERRLNRLYRKLHG